MAVGTGDRRVSRWAGTLGVVVGRLVAVLCVALVAFVFLTGSGSSSSVATASCAHPCGSGSETIGRTGPSGPTPCIRDVGCGGGAALGSSVSVVAVVLIAVGAAVLGVGVWRRRRPAFCMAAGRVFAGGLFRPPRVLVNG